jgi:hypothetical protein
MLHDGLRGSVRVPGDVADRQQVAACAIEEHDAVIAQVLIVLLVEFAGAIDEQASELARLGQETERLRMERDILERSIAIFAGTRT